MAHPKKKQSKSRRDKRRNNCKKYKQKLFLDKKTNLFHIMHNCYWFNNKLYYKGKIFFKKK